MAAVRYEQNFGNCQLGEQRLNRRALSIGQALSANFGQGLSSVFEDSKELKHAYEFSVTAQPVLQRLSRPTV